MTTPPEPIRRFTFRTFTNMVSFIALLLAVDWGFAWLRDQPTYACTAAHSLGTEAILSLFGMGGLVIAIIGIALGGVRHPMSALGLLVMAAGLLGGALLADSLGGICG
jgi:hypothetical protein